MAILTYFICIPISFFATDLIVIMYGDAYKSAGIVLSMLIWGTTFVNLGLPRNAFMYTKGFYRLQSEITITSCIINIILNIFLIPKYGAIGAAVATLISYSYATFFSNFLYAKIRENGWMMLQALYKPRL